MGDDPASPGCPLPVHLALSGKERRDRSDTGGQRNEMDTSRRSTGARSRGRSPSAAPGLAAHLRPLAAAALVTLLVAAGTGCLIEAGASDTVPPPDHRAQKAAPAAVASHEVPGTVPPGEIAFLGPVRQVQAGDITVGYRQLGSGPPVVLVVGQGSTMAMWGTELPRRLAERHQVTMYDLRGVGYSTDPATTPLTIPQMADDLAALIDALGLDRPTVVGWSTGGEIALAFATAHPGKAGALVLSGATAGGPRSVPAGPGAEAAVESRGLH